MTPGSSGDANGVDLRSMREKFMSPIGFLFGFKKDGRGRNHYIFRIGSETFAYCYIRKNACTAFKKLIIDHSPFSHQIEPGKNPIYWMNDYHRSNDVFELQRCKYRIFVYRDPLERIASLYTNKFISMNGADDILRSYETVVGCSAAQASFDDFVNLYLSDNDVDSLDPHVWSQRGHLHNIKYTHAIDMRKLGDVMTKLLGGEKAEKYFGRPVNASYADRLDSVEDLSGVPAESLRVAYQRYSILPSKAQLLRPHIERRLREVYRPDCEFYTRIQQ